MRNSILWACLLVVFLAIPAMAQAQGVRYGGWGGVSVGPQQIDTGDLSSNLYPIIVDFSDFQPVLGGHAYGVIAKYVVLGARGNYVHVVEDGPVSNAEMTSYNYQGELGVSIFNNEWGILFPFGGFGMVKHRLEFSDKSQPEIVEAFGTANHLNKNGMYAVAGFSYLYALNISEEDAAKRALFVGGLHLGATFEVSDEDWTDEDGDDVNRSPAYKFDTFFLLFDIGFGGGV
ncbi:MAG: hypothetical protein P9L99_16605 [Candidatus Lernaella stagnicola]|nr:hypothetical protein [Candidatus Lernaella stagnicola]